MLQEKRMKRPEVIMVNSVSLDNRITGFEANMGLHYRIVNEYGADFYMAGSNTAKTGIEMFGGAPPETQSDYSKPSNSPLAFKYLGSIRILITGAGVSIYTTCRMRFEGSEAIHSPAHILMLEL